MFRFPKKLLISFWDLRLSSIISIRESGKKIFKIYDYGQITRMRGKTFEKKEPETIKWIKSFKEDELLIDIGANIGIYSLYAGIKNINVVSIEPDALNYALLNLNIRLNNLCSKITPYCIAIHDKNKYAKFNISSYQWGGALNSFDNRLDQWGIEYKPVHFQGIYGTTLDKFIEETGINPKYLKIDVDGNENLILKGSVKLLNNKQLKSILIELDSSRNDYHDSISIIENSGYKLDFKTRSNKNNNPKFSNTFNHIFIRK